ncbi:hypothetical protein L7F22_051553 [Adiantum nelumboides]|nr:hypothetical protein [Adiantum nelumboides]
MCRDLDVLPLVLWTPPSLRNGAKQPRTWLNLTLPSRFCFTLSFLRLAKHLKKGLKVELEDARINSSALESSTVVSEVAHLLKHSASFARLHPAETSNRFHEGPTTGADRLPKEMHEMKLQNEGEKFVARDKEKSGTDGNNAGAGHVIVTTFGASNGQPKQPLSYVAERAVGTGSFGIVFQYIQAQQRRPLVYVKLYSYQICRALACVHNALGVCHRDIKPQNLLVNPHSQQVKLCDFGSAKMLVKGEPNIAYICSRYYRAPELIFGAVDYTTSIDIWSVGCVIAELPLG